METRWAINSHKSLTASPMEIIISDSIHTRQLNLRKRRRRRRRRSRTVVLTLQVILRTALCNS
jgi:hypothetical protein